LCSLIYTASFSLEKLNFQLNGLDIKEFISITSKITKENIYIVDNIDGKIDFISNKDIYKKDLLNILKYILNSKGYILKKENGIYSVLKKSSKKKQNTKEYVEVLHLENSESKSLLKILNGMKKKSSFKKLLILSDDEQNSIILMGKKDEVDSFKGLIKKLDIAKRQVYVQAKIIEVSELNTKRIGVQYGFNGFNRYSSGLVGFSSSLNSIGKLPNIGVSELGGFGYNLASMKNGLSLGIALNLLAKNGAADIISEPSILCINNKASSIYVGETRSIKTSSTITNGGNINETYKREDIGLTLKIKPRISKDDRVFLDISTKIEDIGQSTTNNQPNTTKKELETSAIVYDGESVILGGYIKSRIEKSEEKVPFFGDIPILGNLFKNDVDLNDKVNLVIIVTPYIIPKSKNITYIRQKLTSLRELEDKYTKKVEDSLGKKKLDVQKKVKAVSSQKEIDYDKLHQSRIDKILGN
jgi:general secretion pathway protein D